MATIRQAQPSDLSAVTEYLARTMGGGGAARFRRFFEYTWLPSRPDLGMLIEDRGRVRGFIGAIYSRRRIRGEDHALCNINSWHVDDDLRMLSLPMLQALLDRREYDFTCVSPSKRVIELLRFFKFAPLDHEKVLFFPLSGAPLAPCSWRFRLFGRDSGIEQHLDGEQIRIFRDHVPYRCQQLLIEQGPRRCFVVMARRGRWPRVFADVLHVSDPALFSETAGFLAPRLQRTLGAWLVGVDRRFVPGRPPRTFVYRGLRASLYRSAKLLPTDLDTLYSEFVPMFG